MKRPANDIYTDLTTTDLPNQTAFRDAVAHERRVELAFENHRWFDLVRTGKAIEVMSAYGQIELANPTTPPPNFLPYDKPFILMISYGIPHFPHQSAPPEFKELYPVDSIKLRPNVPEWRQEQARAEAQGYYAHSMALDRCIGELMKTLEETGEAENTIVVFTADHGEMLGSQGQSTKEKQRPWDESIRIPFLIRYPAVYGTKGYEVKAPLNTPDILPTLLTMSNITIPGSVEGENLTNFIATDSIDDRTALIMSVYPFAGYHDGDPFRGIRTAQYTYVRNPNGPWLMYDNTNDPYQLKNLVNDPAYSTFQSELENKLQAKLEERGDTFQDKEQYLNDWGYEVNSRGGEIPYKSYETRVQSPSYRLK